MLASPILETVRLTLPDQPGPYTWSPPELQEPGVRLVRLIHNGVTQPRRRKDVEAVQEGAWTYQLRKKGVIAWACYEWLAPKTHKLRIEIDRSQQAVLALVAWLRAHPEALRADDVLAAVGEGCEEALVRRLLDDDGFRASFELFRLLAAR